MKPSRYNFVYPYQFNREYSVVFNTLRDTIGIVTAREAEFIRTCDRSLGIHYTKINDFIKKGFVKDENTGELSLLKVEYLKAKFDSGILTVVIMPTYRCSDGCTGRCEKWSESAEDNTVMSERVQDSICRWIENSLQGVEKLEICWHGGEPLLAPDVVKRLGGKLKKLADGKKIQYVSKLSASGQFFTEKIVKEMKMIGISEYMIALESRRASCDKIVNCIEESAGLIDKIDLRIPADKENLADAYDLVSALEKKGLGGKVALRLEKPDCFAGQVNEKTFTREEFGCEAVRLALLQDAGPKDFIRKGCFCLAHQLNGVIIDSHGMMFKCTTDTGTANAAGD